MSTLNLEFYVTYEETERNDNNDVMTIPFYLVCRNLSSIAGKLSANQH